MAGTPTSDRNYDVISVMYHLLQGSDTLDQYRADAEDSNDDELAAFFQEVQENNRQLAEKAQKLLKKRLQ
ncbi:hypothetical protein F6455_02155 [Proteobacteria bacterium 005FR1]|nr:hypothetical protein [Proteobacteria bacterium 005FR1]